ncbi:MAG: hypothetical protein KIT84_32750 [Labilithrix sp.]|nr:hypothetical protein [Labilithrix sp.]MCW5815845.1 hypothetical protein [Labilithrix sp.]
MKLGLITSLFVTSLSLGCQQASPPPPRAVASTPPTLTSAPVPPPSPAGPRWHGDETLHVHRYDFVLTPKDPKDAIVGPTSFSVNITSNHTGEVTVGRNVPLVPPSGPAPATPPRQDVGLKVKAHPQGLAGTEDVLVDVELEMSTMEGSAIRKLTTHGTALAPLGKATLVVSVDDDKRRYELTVTPTKLR